MTLDDGTVRTFADPEPVDFCNGQGSFSVFADLTAHADGTLHTVFSP